MDNPNTESSAALDTNGAAAAFGAFFGDEPQDKPNEAQAAPEGETEELAAERLAAEEAGTDGDGEDDQPAEPQKFTIRVDGKEVELTADEMAEHYKAGLRQVDYTKKTMEVAEQRKAAEAEATKAREQRDQYAGKLEVFASQANYELQALASQLTDELLQTDPVEYLSKQRIVQQRHAELAQAQRELEQINGQRAQERADAERQHIAHQQEQLLAKVPEWKDADKARAEVAKIKEYLATQGYEAAESDFTDHRQVILARKAMQFDALMAKAKEATKKVTAAPSKVQRPGSADSAPKATDGRTTAMKRLSATGSINDAAAIFSQM